MAEDEGLRISEREVSGIFESFRPVKEFDEETGIFVPFMKMNCYICKSEQSMIMLLDDKGKLCTRDFYCHACNIGSATQDPMKRYIGSFRKERNSLLRFPDEKFSAHIDMMKEYQPNIVKMVDKLKEAVEAGDPVATNIANNMRQTKTYKAYPKSLGDENRLFMTISSYFERFEHRFEGKTGDEKFDEFVRLLRQDRA
jgi:hypothetical protein